MSIQNTNNWKGNRASRRAFPAIWAFCDSVKREVNARAWAMQAQIAEEINPKICREDLETRMIDDRIEVLKQQKPARQANRRKTDSKGLRGGGSDSTFFHPEMGRPEVGIRMVSISRKNEGLEVEIEGEEENSENVKSESGVVV